MATNQIFANPKGFTEIIFVGTQNADSIMQIIKDSLPFDNELSSQGKPIRTLMDLSGIDDIDAGAAKQAITGFSAIDYDKIAAYGANEQVAAKLAGILNLTGKDLPVKLFKNREEALAWL